MNFTYFNRNELKTLGTKLLNQYGMPEERANITTELLIQSDELGFTTHGLSLIPYYIPELQAGKMQEADDVVIVNDTGSTFVWNAQYLPGIWMMNKAMDEAFSRIKEYGVVTASINRAHHIGCLSTYVKLAADKDLICIVSTSDPAGKLVAPFGGLDPVLTPNPWAIGYPTSEDPVIIDTVTSICTFSKVREHLNTGLPMPYPMLQDKKGNESTDATVINDGGAILPIGGADYGHRGYCFSMMVEMLTQGLSGHGRADDVSRWGGNVYIQLIDPEAFAGLAVFKQQMDKLTELCLASRPKDDTSPVRVPGQFGLDCAKQSKVHGVRLNDETLNRLQKSAQEAGIEFPKPH
ncbi:L-lactate dehydrogenase [Marinomonas spartinae]|uniref:L-lactate dehydrogenase n=1 Tax=Marinomonas spartinae TaxID=1792290 RepID=A0A1A8T0C5_9GAMM|nr:Ldh family oxidoreductase [Marinomonas spartinae]SBS24756.1 L-lactate dehydrogenase [Marinomonas spartinae]SBS25287.1 L-lactate dehydrogenase [Marinomonas spartinae]